MISVSNISLKTKLTLYSAFIVILVAVLISISSYNASKKAIEKQTGQYVSTSVEQIKNRTDSFLKNIHNIGITMAFNKSLIGIFWRDKFDYTRDFPQVLDFVSETILLNSVNTYIHSIYIYDLKHMIFMSSNGINSSIQEDDENYKIIKDNFVKKTYRESLYLWIGGRKVKIGEEVKKADILDASKSGKSDASLVPITINAITFMMPVMDKYNATLYGILAFNITEKSIASMYSSSNLVSSGDFFIEDSRGMIVSAIDKNLIGRIDETIMQKLPAGMNSVITDIKGRECLVTSFKSKYNGWRYISVIPMKELMKENNRNLINALLLTALIIIVLFIVGTYTFNSFFFKPVKDLIKGIRLSVQKHEEIDLKVKRKDEIGFVFNNFNEILRENNKLIKEVYDQKIASKNSELRLLQSQINPHFLYNSLYTAIGMIKFHDNETAIKIIESLIDLFRLSLERKNENTTVKKMLDNLNSYITIQKYRYIERLNVIMDMDDRIMEYKVLNLLLQPLVENSIYHGIEKKWETGEIRITGKREGDMLIFIVDDNGVGISADKLQEIRELIDTNKYEEENYYALQNINKRVKLYYGEQYGISIESKENEWTRVTLTLPVIEEHIYE